MIVALAALAMMSSNSDNWQRWGEETLDQIRGDFYLPAQRLYAEDESRKMVAFNWPCGVMLSALNAGARLNDKYKPWLREFVEAMRRYWHPEGGFDVHPLPKERDVYYDDNAWMALALIETSHVLEDRKYLEWAAETARFVLSGEDDRLGGGIYWRERERTSKNTCINAPASLMAARLYGETREPNYLATALRLHDWTRHRLLDPAAQLFWDNVKLNGRVERTVWSYNTALMIRSGLTLAKLTKNPETGRNAKRWTEASIGRWLDPKTGLINDELAFSHLLFESLVEAGAPDLGRYLAGLHDKARDANGRYGHRWSDVADRPRTRYRLIDQASAARAYLVAALRG